MTFTGNEEHVISLEAAAKMTRAYRDSAGPGAQLGVYFSKKAISSILDISGCVGIRIYHAEKEDGTTNFVLVGVDVDENDMERDIILEYGFPCPPYCSAPNELNGM